MRGYSEDDIRRAVDEVIAAGMERFLYQEPFASESSSQSKYRNSERK